MSKLAYIEGTGYACAILEGMSGAQFKGQNEAPPVSPGTPFSFVRQNSLGAQNKNVTKNHSIVSPLTRETISGERFSNETEPAPFIPKIHDIKDSRPPEVLRPGDYHPGYCQQMLDWFDKPKTQVITDTYTWKSGAVSEKERHVPATPPHFSEFARSIGVSTRRLKIWARDHEEFREAYVMCEEILEEFLIDNGLTGAYGAIAMKFVAVNRTKMKDKVVTENVTLDINKVLDQIARGEVKPGGHLEIASDDL